MPKRSVHAVFEEFVSSLSTLIKERVAESVQTATAEFLASKFMAGQAEAPKKVRRRRGKKPGRKPAPAPTVSRKRRRAAVKSTSKSSPITDGAGVASPKPVTLSKNGKRIGRPPKIKSE